MVFSRLVVHSSFLTSCVPIIQSHNPAPVNAYPSYDTFEMYVDSVTLNLPHNKEYLSIIYSTFPKSENNKPFNKYIRQHVKALLNSNGYRDEDESKKIQPIDLIPIVIGLSLYSSDDKPLLILNLRAKNFALKTSDKHELLSYRKFYEKSSLVRNNNNKLELKGIDASPLWSLTLMVEGGIPMNEEFTIIAMIKCAEPYLNKNFKDVVVCKK